MLPIVWKVLRNKNSLQLWRVQIPVMMMPGSNNQGTQYKKAAVINPSHTV